MATSGIRVVVKFDKVKDVAGFKAAMKELMEATRKGRKYLNLRKRFF